uniref:Putative secreted protein n=1 Tax=Anopheles triannulatus TaxID=58253 RepID=A0A2M4B3M6_9DIPT
MIRLELLATIMSVTWSSVLPSTSIPFTSSTSSLTASRPVLSANPPGTRREMKIPGSFSNPFEVTRIDVPSRM